MSIPADIKDFVRASFPAHQQDSALERLAKATLHDGTVPGPRTLRCATYAGRGDIDKLEYYINLLCIDYRDVIVAGEYDVVDGKLVRVRNLTDSFPSRT